MKILVPTKRVPDTDQRIRVRHDGQGIQDDALPYVINPFDAIALEEALRIRENAAAEVEVVTVGIGGPAYETELRSGLAMGADRAILVQCDQQLDPWNVARLLQAVVRREQPDLVLMGKQAVDDDANQAGQFLAAILDWPQATFVSKIELTDGHANVVRETDAGLETVRVRLPAVITADLRLNEPRYASLPSIMKSRKKPIENVDWQELNVQLEPRLEVLAMESSEMKRQCIRVNDVEELIAKLKEETDVY